MKWRIFLISLVVLSVPSCYCFSQPLIEAKHLSYVSYYDLQGHIPAVVLYNLHPTHFSGSYSPKTRHFKQDRQLPPPRVKDEDYANSGYVRGHLCPAGDRDSYPEWMKDTYSMANVIPMTMVTNSGPIKAVEDSCRLLAMNGHPLTIAVIPVFPMVDFSPSAAADDMSVLRSRDLAIVIPTGVVRWARCAAHPNENWIWFISNVGTKSTAVRVTSSMISEMDGVRPCVLHVLARYGFPINIIPE